MDSPKVKQPITLRKVIKGSILTAPGTARFVPITLYVFVLALILIANRNYSEATIRKIEKTQNELKELKSESTIYSVYLETINLPSNIEALVQQAGLNLAPPNKALQKIPVKYN